MTEPLNQYFTPKMGLVVHGINDGLDSAVRNWDRLDDAFSGVIWVQPGITPDNTVLYDGAIVAETTTGKVWRAEKQVDGSFARKWIKYPWLISCVLVTPTTNPNQGEFLQGFSGIDANHCVNSSASDLVNTRIVVPHDGLYAIRARAGWSEGGNYRSMRIAIDDVIDSLNAESIHGSWPTFPYVQNNLNLTRKLSKGQTVLVAIWQNSGSTNVPVDIRMEVAMVQPT